MQRTTSLIPPNPLDYIDEIVYAVEASEGNPSKGTVRLVSGRVEQLLGYRPDEFLANPDLWFELIHPADRQPLMEQTQRIYESRKPGVRLYRVRHKLSGEYRWMEDAVTPQLDAAGCLVGIFGVARDITERRSHEETLTKLSRALEQTADLVVITQQDGVIEYVNPAFESLTGYTRAELRGGTPRVLKSGVHDEGFYRNLWDTILAGRVFRAVFTNRKKGGTLYFEEKTITPLRDAAGATTHFVSTGKDVTERVQMEARLRQAQKMEALGQLAAGVAHDFNNILTVVTGYGGLLKAALADQERLHPWAKSIVEAGGRAADLTRQLLAFSRRQVLEVRVLDLNEVVGQVEEMLRRVLGDQAELVTKPGQGLGSVRADPTQVEQIIINLAVNARDAMPEGGRITIETCNTELDESSVREMPGAQPGSYVTLSVSDTGSGMDATTRVRIFEPFFTTKEAGKGTGLGLATVYGIVKQSGGYIWVSSEPGRGTSFRVHLPRVGERPEPLPRTEESILLPRGSESLLLVEDDPAVRLFAALVLREQGYRVLEATEGSTALRVAREAADVSLDLLIADVVMPGIPVRQLVEEFRAMCPTAKILFVSGYAGETIAHRGVLEAGLALLQKPFTAGALARKVREVLDARSMG